jgi:cytidylate kinase
VKSSCLEEVAMAVLTISRQIGSGGASLARDVASSLGYSFADKELLGRLLGEYGLVEFHHEYDDLGGFWNYFDQRSETLVDMLNRAILAIAARGNAVIVGRGAFALLGGFEDALNVRIQAPFPDRVRNVQGRNEGMDMPHAVELVRKSDRERSAFIKMVYDRHWEEADAYNLVIDTAAVPRDLAVSWIVAVMRDIEGRHAGKGRRLADIDVDPILAEAVDKAFADQG